MSWLNLNNIKGQITSIANDFLPEGIGSDSDQLTELSEANQKIKELQNLISSQNVEIALMKKLAVENQQQNPEKPSPQNSKQPADNNGENLEDSWFWSPDSEHDSNQSDTSSTSHRNNLTNEQSGNLVEALQARLKLEHENNEKLSKKIWELDGALKQNSDIKQQFDFVTNESFVLKQKILELSTENDNLSTSLEELDAEHQQAMDKMLSIKTELQKKCDDLNATNDTLKKNVANLESQMQELKQQTTSVSPEQETSKVQHLEDDKVVLNDKIKQMTTDVEELKKKNDELESLLDKEKTENVKGKENDKLKAELEHVNTLLENLKDENVELQRKINDNLNLVKNYDALEKKEVSILEENLKIKNDCQKANEDLSVLQEENLELQRKIQELQDNKDASKLNEELNSVRKNEAKLFHENSRFRIDFDKVNEDLAVVQEENLDLQQKLVEFEKTKSQEMMKIWGEIDVIKNNEALLKEENYRMKMEIDTYKESNNDYDDINYMRKDYEKVKGEVQELLAENLRLHQKYSHLDKEHTRLKMDYSKVQEDIMFLRTENIDYQQELHDLKLDNVDIDTLKEELSKSTDELKLVRSENLRLEQVVMTLKTLDQHQKLLLQENTQWKKAMEKSKQDVCDLQEENLDLQQQLFSLQATLAETKIDEATGELLAKIKALEGENSDLRTEILSYQDIPTTSNLFLRNNTGEIRALESQINMLTLKNKQMCEDRKKLELDIHSLQEDNIDLHTHIFSNEGNLPEISSLEKLVQKYELYAVKLNTEGSFLENIESLLKLLKENNWKIETLEKKLIENSREIHNLNELKTELETENSNLSFDLTHYKEECDSLVKNNDMLIIEVEKLKSSKLETISENNEESFITLEQQLEDCSNLNHSLEDEYKTLEKKLEDSEVLKKEFEIKLAELENEVAEVKNKLKKAEAELVVLDSTNCHLQFEIDEMKVLDPHFLLTQIQNAHLRLEKMEVDSEVLNNNIRSLSQANDKLKEEKSNLETKIVELNTHTKTTKYEVLSNLQDQLRQKIENEVKLSNEIERLSTEVQVHQHNMQMLTLNNNELQEDSIALRDQLRASKSLESSHKLQIEVIQKDLQNYVEANNMLEKKIQILEPSHTPDEIVQQYKMEITDIKSKYDTYVLENQNMNLKVEELTAANSALPLLMEEKQVLENQYGILVKEKNELIALITLKHEENIKYHGEIQRLNVLLKAEIEKTKDLTQKCEELSQNLKANEGNRVIVQQNSEEMKEKLVEIEKLNDQVTFLREKCDILTKSLITEQTNVKLLHQERDEMLEKENNLVKELARLRQHLVEIEEANTLEIMALETKNNDLQTRVNNIEEHAKHSNTAYTSASIRANQQAETLQAQLLLISQQRDDLVLKLNESEDKSNKQLAALTNLQCALEQFQRDKDQDLHNSTERLRVQVDQERNKQGALNAEIANLRTQLNESQQGLMAASRIADQLEIAQGVSQGLKQELKTSQEKLLLANGKLEAALSNQADKIEKNLIKNLIIGYISTHQNVDKTQILKIISTVLDFNQPECDRIGLNKNQQSWFGGLLQNHPGTPSQSNQLNKDSLAQAFVKFLEKESQPKVNNLPNLLNLNKTADRQSPKIDNPENLASNQPANVENLQSNTQNPNAILSGSNPSPGLLNESILTNFIPPRNASAILKDVLKDSNN